MRTLKRVILATLCICMLTVGPSVFAASDDQTSADMVQQLVEEAEKMDPESTESVEKFAELLDTWDIGSEDSSDATSSLSGTMNSLQDLSGDNIQVIFAQLQQQLDQMCKDQAAKKIEQIQKQQEQQKQCTELTNQLRELNSTIKSTGTPVALSEDIKSRLIELGICSAGDAVMDKDRKQYAAGDGLYSGLHRPVQLLSAAIKCGHCFVRRITDFSCRRDDDRW